MELKNADHIKSQNRIEELDLLKGIAILCVMMVHIPERYELITTGISFHLAPFFMVSGILLEKRTKRPGTELAHRIRTLLWPYLCLSVLYLLVFGLRFAIFAPEGLQGFLVCGLFQTLSGSGIGTLWFLPTMFLSELLFLAVRKRLSKAKACICLLSGLALSVMLSFFLYRRGCIGGIMISPSGFGTALLQLLLQSVIGSGFMALGPLLWEGMERLLSAARLPAILYFFLFLALNELFYPLYSGNDMHYARIINPFGFLLCTCLGSFALFFLARALKESPFAGLRRFLQFFGMNSLIVMTTHLEYGIADAAGRLAGAVLPAQDLFMRILTFVLLCTAEAAVCMAVRHTPLRYFYRFPNKNLL